MTGDRISLHVDVTSQPLTGVVVDDRGGEQAFTGWIELVSAIESRRDAVQAEDAIPQTRRDP